MGRSSSNQQGSIESSTNPKSSKKDQEPHLSGAYIRSLVKQLTSSKSSSSSSTTTKSINNISLITPTSDPKLGETRKQSSPPPPPPPPRQQHKKQVRRRLHTSRPYQERLLNMAEARREIVTALKFHRASMKQQQQERQLIDKTEPQQQQQQHLMYQPSCSRNNSSISHTMNPYLSSPWPNCSNMNNLNLTLPSQTLGLNLNIQDFNNFDTSLYNNINKDNNNTFYDYPFSTNHEFVNSEELNIHSAAGPGGGSGVDGLYHEMDDEEMAEIRSLGDQHEMEWKDKMNLVTSTWWFKYLKSMDSQFDQVMEFPSWLNNGHEGCFDQHFNDLSFDDYFQDPTLPRMDIEEIEAMDGEWLS